MVARRSSNRSVLKPKQSGRAPQKRVIATAATNFPVVGIGASAGGLEAFRTLFAALPAQSEMAFILVQHLAPTRASMMGKLLSSHTSMPVQEAREGMRIEPGNVCIIPPGRYIIVRNGVVHLSRPPAGQAVRMPFDVLLQSLAAEFAERAVCVILSGTATDGSVGAKAIADAGGLVIAQDPGEADYDGMPRGAIATGAVDLVLPLAKMPEALVKYGGHRYLKTANSPAPPLTDGAAKIIDLLSKKTSHNFALYREGTLGRRIERRMAMAGIEDSDRYIELLTKDATELHRLANDLFINVTRFFRDAKIFEHLAEKTVPELVRAQPEGQPIRIWVVGCSTGEEAYSIAMLFLEEIATAKGNIKLQIFASDIDEDAIAIARDGLFPLSIEANVSPERLARFFIKQDHGYRVSRELRTSIVFSVHDVIADAPFSRLDLISCRNLLIYLRREVQERVLSLFHFALREGGILFLGTSESVGGFGDQFESISKSNKIYRHIGRGRPGEVKFHIAHREPARSLWLASSRPAAAPRFDVSDLAHKLLLDRYAPASVLVNRKHQGLYYFGPTDRYLKMPAGVANLDILASAREGLRPAVRAALEKASQGQEKPVTISGRVKLDGRPVAVTALPVKNDGEELILLSFVDLPRQEPTSEATVEPPADAFGLAQLEQELDGTRKDLENAVRDRDTAEEEIRAINEEAMSVNEEFQTTNEELETSREELQSLNEELTVINNQLQETLDQHKAIANDLENILYSADLATLFLDEKLNIRFFTPAAKALFSVISSDVGRPLADLAHHFADGHLLADAQMVITKLVPLASEVRAENGGWYNCRILPYRTKENRIEGVVITFADITARKQAEDALIVAKSHAESANLGKSRFLAAASHDLRQPLQTLSLLQGVLTTKSKDREVLQLLARADETLKAMSGMLNTLLDINQLEAGVIHPEFVDFPIDSLLERLKAEFTYHTQAHGLSWHVVPSSAVVHSDPRLLEQMVRNLLSNAVKYTKAGVVLLGCRHRGKQIRIEVWDTGLGIPEGQLDAIFNEFHQIDNPARESSRGLGLGLAIVKRLADLLGHAVSVRSRHGRGSVFAIDVAIAPEGAHLALKGLEREPEKIATRDATILIVEDDPTLREVLELLLRGDGHRIAAAADGPEALELVASMEAKPDIVIIDYNLPGGLTGLQIITRLREMIGHNLPTLVLTGDISKETLREIAQEGYTHRSKPIRADDLKHVIQSLLARRS
jgi:two-component system, chemotaxis family, CheB/CheR fusion protein